MPVGDLKANNLFQASGQGISYGRRYALVALVMGYADDDNDAVIQHQKSAATTPPAAGKQDGKRAVPLNPFVNEIKRDWLDHAFALGVIKVKEDPNDPGRAILSSKVTKPLGAMLSAVTEGTKADVLAKGKALIDQIASANK